MIADGKLSFPRIAKKLKIGRATLFRWRQVDEFKDRVSEHLAELKADTLRFGIADRRRRVAEQNDRWNRMRVIVQERAADPEMKGVPGGRSGLLVRKYKSLGGGEETQIVEEFSADTPLLKAFLDLEKHTAIELGQWVEKQDHSVPSEVPNKIQNDLDRIYGDP